MCEKIKLRYSSTRGKELRSTKLPPIFLNELLTNLQQPTILSNNRLPINNHLQYSQTTLILPPPPFWLCRIPPHLISFFRFIPRPSTKKPNQTSETLTYPKPLYPPFPSCFSSFGSPCFSAISLREGSNSSQGR